MATREEEQRRYGLAAAMGGYAQRPQPTRQTGTLSGLSQTGPQRSAAYYQQLQTTAPQRQATIQGAFSSIAAAGSRPDRPEYLSQPQPGTDAAVGAQRDAGAVRPPVVEQQQPRTLAEPQQPPPQYSNATGRDANPPSLGQRAIANQRLGGAEVTQGPAGMQRQALQGGPPLAQGEQRLMGQDPARTRYVGSGGVAEFQGMRQGGGGFGGAATNAQAAATLADYRSRGLNMYGNDMNAINQLNQTADQMQAARLKNVAGNPEFSNRERAQSLATLGTLQQGQQIQQEGQQAQAQQQAATEQQGFENAMELRDTRRQEALAQLQISNARREELARSPFSQESMMEIYKSGAGLGGTGAYDALSGWVQAFGGLYDPGVLTGKPQLLKPDDLAEYSPEEIAALKEKFDAYAMQQAR